jgi:hypothetical protein
MFRTIARRNTFAHGWNDNFLMAMILCRRVAGHNTDEVGFVKSSVVSNCGEFSSTSLRRSSFQLPEVSILAVRTQAQGRYLKSRWRSHENSLLGKAHHNARISDEIDMTAYGDS